MTSASGCVAGETPALQGWGTRAVVIAMAAVLGCAGVAFANEGTGGKASKLPQHDLSAVEESIDVLVPPATLSSLMPPAPEPAVIEHNLGAAAEELQVLLPPATLVALAPPPVVRAPGNAGHKVAGKYDVSRIGERGVGRGLDFYSLDKERELGKQLAAEVEHDSRLISDPVVIEYVNRVGQNLVRNSDAKVPFTIKVVDNDEINAFALPGGFFYVNSGLVLAADNEAELAGVMAHEIAHVACRHATKNATKAEIWNLVSIPLIFMGGPAGYAIRQVSGLLVPMSFLKFSRDAEREADLLGLEYQYASGYDPQSFVQFFEKLKVQEKKHKHTMLAKAFSTHPMTDDRIRQAQDEIEHVLPAREDYMIDTSEFQQVKARLAGITSQHMIDGGNGPRPTLRKRSKGGDDANDDGRPTLHRKD